MRRFIYSAAAVLFILSGQAMAAEGVKIPSKPGGWSFEGIFGKYDRPSAQRGFQVFKEVCAGCHSLNLIYFRNFMDLGYTEDQVKAFAKEYEVAGDLNDDGESTTRPAKPSDRFPAPFPNEKAARASNGGAFPPDLSLIVEARKSGPDYLYALLTGYEDAPEGFNVPDGMNYNKYFPGHNIAMAAPLGDDTVEYADGTAATTAQMAEDIVTFLAWASEPNMEARKGMGIKVMLFLIAFTGMLIAVKKKVWADVH